MLCVILREFFITIRSIIVVTINITTTTRRTTSATTTTPTSDWSTGADGLKLKSNGFNFVSATPKNYSVLHGPYVISDNAVTLAVGDSVQFDWLATGAGDDYDVFGYLLDKNTGQTIDLLDSYGSSGNGTVNKSIAAGQAGDYNFVFISGT